MRSTFTKSIVSLIFGIWVMTTVAWTQCNVNLPALSVSGECVEASFYPTSADGQVETLWAINDGQYISAVTSWSTSTSTSYCPSTSGWYRLCSRVVGCSTMYELSDVYVELTSFPVEWLGFDAKNVSNEVLLGWATAKEQNSSYFEVERSLDGLIFEAIGRVEASGNTDNVRRYSFTDHDIYNMNGQTVAYRLRQVDIDGSFSYSNVKQLDLSVRSSLDLNIYPNPVVQRLNINWSTFENARSLQVMNINGQRVYEKHFQSGEDLGSAQIDVENWARGTYLLKVTTPVSSEVRKFVIR